MQIWVIQIIFFVFIVLLFVCVSHFFWIVIFIQQIKCIFHGNVFWLNSIFGDLIRSGCFFRIYQRFYHVLCILCLLILFTSVTLSTFIHRGYWIYCCYISLTSFVYFDFFFPFYILITAFYIFCFRVKNSQINAANENIL